MKLHPFVSLRMVSVALAVGSLCGFTDHVFAQQYPITSGQRQTAQTVAEKGVPISELASDAPDQYTVKRADTLWDISTMFLKSPWHWPELWGMNYEDIRNPHRIYPGQHLLLIKSNGKASLRVGNTDQSSQSGALPDGIVRVSPRTRSESLSDLAIPAINPAVIEAFLTEPLIVNASDLQNAPRIVSPREDRVLISRGDRVYARGPSGAPLLDNKENEQLFRIFHKATPLKDPSSGEVLGYEAQFAGKAVLVRSEIENSQVDTDGASVITPATIDVISSKEEIHVGDRLLPEPNYEFLTYIPHAPANPVQGRVVSVYGSSIVNAGQNQVVSINLGKADGIDRGTVLAVLRDGSTKTDPEDAQRTRLKLPDERNGLLMVFRTFERVSYALILEISDTVRVGDRLVSPR